MVAVCIIVVAVLLRVQRRRTLAKSYTYAAQGLPPTLDIIRSLGHDREAEYTDGTMVVSQSPTTAASSYNFQVADDSIVMRKSYWPTTVYDAANPIQIYKDAIDDEEIRFSRKTYWPNDSHNDATNPIHVFDDISVRSDVEDSINITSFGDDDDNDSTGIDSEEIDGQYTPRII
jgi:hypothetical protein